MNENDTGSAKYATLTTIEAMDMLYDLGEDGYYPCGWAYDRINELEAHTLESLDGRLKNIEKLVTDIERAVRPGKYWRGGPR